MKKILNNLYDGICAVLKEAKDIRKELSGVKREQERIHGLGLEILSGIGALRLELEALKSEMDARGEAADVLTQRANKMFEDGMESLFGYRGG